MKEVKLSIITVCYNADTKIEKTISSILGQIWTDFEYVVVDGRSSDKTLQIINKYKSVFEKKGIDCRIISEQDNGIYDAMNKGAKLAQGSWLIYLNAGDIFFDNDVLFKVNRCFHLNADVIYGDTIEINKNKWRKACGQKVDKIIYGMIFCHQSAFIKRKRMIENYYKDNYKICADYDFFLKLYNVGAKFIKINTTISVFELDGISSQNGFDVRRENIHIRFSNKIITERRHKLCIFRINMDETLKHILPSIIFKIKKKIVQRNWIDLAEYKHKI